MPADAEHPVPSRRARELVRGAFDVHVHIEPDLIGRRITDLELAHRFAELGLAGFVLKSHYAPTAERAAVVRAAVPGVQALGAITLNRGVGGLNPTAVEIAARAGARIVWLPTVDAANELEEVAALPREKQPLWRRLQEELAEAGIDEGPVELDPRALDDVLRVVARHRLALATGHLSAGEIETVADAAFAAGVETLVVTHPDYPTQAVPLDAQRALADRGALLERCFAPIHSGKVSWEQTFESIRATGAESNVLSTDLGQPKNPPVEDGLALMADRLLDAGFSEEDVRVMAVANTRRLATDLARV